MLYLVLDARALFRRVGSQRVADVPHVLVLPAREVVYADCLRPCQRTNAEVRRPLTLAGGVAKAQLRVDVGDGS